jgi:uncharacterized phage protein (TIGR02218 family)
MRAVSSAFISFALSGQPCIDASLITIDLAAGGTIYLTTLDQPITYGGNVYQATGAGPNGVPAVDVGEWSVVNTIDVPTCDIQFYSDGTDWQGGQNFKTLVHQGLLTGAYITISEILMPTYGDVSLGSCLVFAGRAGPATITATGVKLTVKGDNVLMQQYMPKNKYSLGCIHTLFDVNCGASRAAFTDTNAVGAGGVNKVYVPWGTAPGSPIRFVQGTLTITSGAGAGQARTIQAANSAGIGLVYPLDAVPAIGDTFTATYGCDKRSVTCSGVFNNLQNRRGFDFIPPAETAT